VTVVLSLVFIRYWGLVGAAGATVVAALAAAIVSFAIGFSKFGPSLPLVALHLTNAFIVSPSCCETASPLLRRIDAIW
jgi:Na+-driven multidrug efflux pump